MAGEGGIAVGRVLRPWGREGALVIEPWTHDPRRFERLDAVDCLEADGRRRRRVLAARIDRDGRPVVLLEGVSSISSAEALRGARLEVEAHEAERPPGAWFNHELLGLEAWTPQGGRLGRVEEVLETGGTNVLVVRGDGHERLLPAAAEILVAVDLEAGRITVDPPAGLLEVNEPEARRAG